MTDDKKELTVPHGNMDPKLWLEIAYDISTEYHMPHQDREKNDLGEVVPAMKEPTVKWLAEKYKLTPKEALGIIAHPKFTDFIHGVMKAIGKVQFDRKAYGVLDEIMTDGSNRERIAAIKVAAELLGYKSPGGGVNVNVSFDTIVRNADLGEGKVIDTEAFPGF